MIYYIIIGLLALFLAAFQVIKKTGAKDLNSYKFLFRDDIYSQGKKDTENSTPTYQLAPVMRGDAYRPYYLYLPEREQYLVCSRLEPFGFRRYDAYAPPHPEEVKRHVLLDKNGKELQRLDTDFNYSIYSGKFFTPEYYINWLDNGDTIKLPYAAIYNQDLKMNAIAFADKFRELHALADYTEYVNLFTSYNDTIGNSVVFKINNDWHMLLGPYSSSHIYGKLKEDPKTGVDSYTYTVNFDYYDKDYDLVNPYPQSPSLVNSVYLETSDPNPYGFNKMANHDGLKMVKYQKLSSTGWQGIAEIKGIPIFVPGTGEGIAYMEYKIGKETINFKIPDVTKYDYRSVYNLGVRVFKIPSGLDVDVPLVFIESTQNFAHYQRMGGGVFVVRPCEAETCNTSSLPNGLDEDRFASLPLVLQVALMDLEGTTQLEINTWYPEIALLTNLKYLKITEGFEGEGFPEKIFTLKNLEYLSITRSGIKGLPVEISALNNLKELDISSNDLKSFPPEIFELKALTHLNIENTGISEIPENINTLTELQVIRLSQYGTISLPDTMVDMKALRIKGTTEVKETLPEKFHFLFEENDY